MDTQRRGIGDRATLPDWNQFRTFPEFVPTYQGLTLLLTGLQGHIHGGLEGLYHHKTRFLSRLELTVNGQKPAFVSANPVQAHSSTAYYLAPAPEGARTQGELAEKAIEVQVDRFVGEGLHQCTTVTNHLAEPLVVTMGWALEADMADLCAPDWSSQPLAGCPVEAVWEATPGGGALLFGLQHDALSHGVRVEFTGPGRFQYARGRVEQTLMLPPREPVKLCMAVHPIFLGEEVGAVYGCGAFTGAGTDRDEAREAYFAEATRLHAANPVVEGAWGRAVADLGALPTFQGEGAMRYTPAAGIPIYIALYGRDVLTTGWHSWMLNPVMLRGALETIASKLGSKYDDSVDEQPGRVIHQHQLSPSALLGHTPYLGYYGDYAGPGLFLMAAAAYFRATGDVAFMRELRDPLLRVLDWMDRDGDRDGDGFYEYDTRAGARGTKNQGWKDSPEAFVYEDGTMAPNPLAACEIQGYYYAGKRDIASVFAALGETATAAELRHQAADLKARFNAAFWLEDEQFYALALDPEKRPLRSIASNAGHLLACGIVEADRAAAVARRLMAPDMFSGWGIRTLSSEHPAYNPFTYHLGSVWPSENATIALGLKRYGFDDAVATLAEGLFAASLLFEGQRLPEAFGGHARDARHPHPGIYPRSCAPQAWSASGVIALVAAMLGLEPDAPNCRLVVAPSLPAWLPAIELHGLTVGPSRLDLRLYRAADGTTTGEVLDQTGPLEVAWRSGVAADRPRTSGI